MTEKDWSFKMALSRARIFARLKKTTALQANIFLDIFLVIKLRQLVFGTYP